MTARLRCAINSPATLLADAGINSARYDAEEFAARLTGAERGRLALIDSADDAFFDRYHAAITARSRRVPLRRITGTAAFGPLTLFVGPGVFIPRPETEVCWNRLPRSVFRGSRAAAHRRRLRRFGALALALAQRWPEARVLGIEHSDAALEYARRNSFGAGSS